MPGLNFGGIGEASVADTVVPPRRIFNALSKKDSRYNYARDVQAEVWDVWEGRRHESDLVVKMNTGGGKTVVGLLMLKSGLNEGIGPSVYLAPNKNLAEQARKEAAGLGLRVTDDPRSGAFRDGRAILVTHVQRLVNGKSVFGVQGDGRQPLKLGTLLIDDAHACLTTVQDTFTLSIPEHHEAYRQMLAVFADALRGQSNSGYEDVVNGNRAAVLRVPYWAWREKQSEVIAALQPHRDDDDLMWAWPLISADLAHCDVVFSADRLELRAAILPIERIPSFTTATRRIYLTATLSDDSVLVTHFGANPDSLTTAITPSSADDLGERMILAPLETHPSVSRMNVHTLLAKKAKTHNVVVLVPSARQAQIWEDIAVMTVNKDNIDEGVAALRGGHVGLVVFINRYDGIDLPGEACRILVIDGVPEVYSGLDRLEMLALDDSDAVIGRQIQRIEQGMGRGVRSKDDHCAVILLDHRLTQRIHGEENLQKFSPATRAQLKLSQTIAAALEDRPFSTIEEVIDQSLQRDPQWIELSIRALDGIKYDLQSQVDPVAVAQVAAYRAARRGQYAEAADILGEATNRIVDQKVRGWVKQQAAMFRDVVDAVRAQELQKSAISDNPYVLKPVDGIGYTRLRAHDVQAKAASDHMRDAYGNGNQLILGFEALLGDLTPIANPSSVEVQKFERAAAELAVHLGFRAQNPEQEIGEGPDVLWSLGELQFAVIECKSGTVVESISKRDLAQLSHSIDWFKSKYDATCTPTPVMIHHSNVVGPEAAARVGTRIMTFESLHELKESVRAFAVALAADEGYLDTATVSKNLTTRSLTGKTILAKYSQDPR